MLEHSVKALSNIDVFFVELNEIDIYVEDTEQGSSKLYTLIFQKVLKDRFKIEKVFTIGGKAAVLSKHKELSANEDRKRLFLIDGDLDLFYNPKIKFENKLLTLGRYCIENYLIDKNAIIELVDEESSLLNAAEIEDVLNFDQWTADNEKILIELFIYFAICKKFSVSVPLVVEGVGKYQKDSSGCVCHNRVEEKITEIKGILTAEKIDHVKEKEKLENTIDLMNSLVRFISAKDFLFPLLRARITQFEKFTLTKAIFKQKLARKCSFDEIVEILKELA